MQTQNDSEHKCLHRYLHLKPGHNSFAMEALPYSNKVGSGSNNESFICHFARQTSGCFPWVTGSGATSYVCYKMDPFVELGEVSPFDTKMKGTSNVTGNEKGTSSDELMTQNQFVECVLKNVLLVPTLSHKFLSGTVVALVTLKVVFKNMSCSALLNENALHRKGYILIISFLKLQVLKHFVFLTSYNLLAKQIKCLYRGYQQKKKINARHVELSTGVVFSVNIEHSKLSCVTVKVE